MSWRNYDDVCEQIAAAGLIIDPKRGLEVGTSTFVRCAVVGDREKRGWYKLHALLVGGGDELIVGSFGIWSANDQAPQKIILKREDRPRITPEQAEAIRARQLADRKAADADLALQELGAHHDRRDALDAAGGLTREWGVAFVRDGPIAHFAVAPGGTARRASASAGRAVSGWVSFMRASCSRHP